MKINVIDFDPGCGGFTKGLEDSGFFEVIYNGSINEANKTTYNKTHKNDFSELDILPNNIDLAVFSPNLGDNLHGLGKKNFNISEINNFTALITLHDIKNIIFLTQRQAIPFLQLSKKVNLTTDNFPTKDIISCRLIDLGYNTYNFVMDGAGFGLPQHKYYNIYWATKVQDQNINIKEGFGMYKRKYRTSKQLLKDINDSTELTWHKPNYNSFSKNIKYYRLPEDTVSRPISNDFYKNTLHPFYDRPLTIREGAVLFGLTNDFDWETKLSKNEVSRMIYNSFPPLISKLMANRIKKIIKNE